MSKAAVLETFDPHKVTKAVTDALPSREEAIADARHLGKAMSAWWGKLPNDGVRVAIPLGALLVAGVVTGLVVGYVRHH